MGVTIEVGVRTARDRTWYQGWTWGEQIIRDEGVEVGESIILQHQRSRYSGDHGRGALDYLQYRRKHNVTPR